MTSVDKQPSQRLNPSFREEDQKMAQELEEHPEVIGVPGYASPDPETSRGRLVPVETHPLEHSEDYGANIGSPAETVAIVPGFEGGVVGTVPDDLDDITQDELKAMAKSRGLPVSGSKKELADRIEEYDMNPPAGEESGEGDNEENA